MLFFRSHYMVVDSVVRTPNLKSERYNELVQRAGKKIATIIIAIYYYIWQEGGGTKAS